MVISQNQSWMTDFTAFKQLHFSFSCSLLLRALWCWNVFRLSFDSFEFLFFAGLDPFLTAHVWLAYCLLPFHFPPSEWSCRCFRTCCRTFQPSVIESLRGAPRATPFLQIACALVFSDVSPRIHATLHTSTCFYERLQSQDWQLSQQRSVDLNWVRFKLGRLVASQSVSPFLSSLTHHNSCQVLHDHLHLLGKRSLLCLFLTRMHSCTLFPILVSLSLPLWLRSDCIGESCGPFSSRTTVAVPISFVTRPYASSFL